MSIKLFFAFECDIRSTCKHIIFSIIITPYRSTMYIDAAYRYRPSSMVSRSVSLWSVTVVSLAKMGESIYTVSQKKGATLTMAITLSILDRFAKFFHCCKQQ